MFLYINMHDGDPKPCWEWTGSLSGKPNDPRPYFSLDGKKQLAYRIVYQLYHGELGDLLVRHKCDNSICCNPHHLEKGTHQENEQDKIDRERNGGLPKTVAERIRSLAKLRDPEEPDRLMFTHAKIAEMFGIARETVTSIVNNRRHKEKSNE